MNFLSFRHTDIKDILKEKLCYELRVTQTNTITKKIYMNRIICFMFVYIVIHKQYIYIA